MTDGAHVVLGHATGTRRWDIFKGLAEPEEAHATAALRELREETGLEAPPDALVPLGTHVYLPRKALVLFAWFPPTLPDPITLRCTSLIDRPGRIGLPELDRFGLFTFGDALGLMGRNLARVLGGVWPLVVSKQRQSGR